MRCASDGQIEAPQHSELLKMDIDQSAEILRLRSTVRDLLALSVIPEAWVGREPPAIAADLADLLVDSLELDFAFVRLCDPKGCQVAEVTRGRSWTAFPEWLQQHRAEFGQFSRKEIVANISGDDESRCESPTKEAPRPLRWIIVIPIGVNSQRGFVAAASNRSNFPDQIDQQLLSVAASNAATAFQNAFLINELRSAQEALRNNEQELRKAHDELEIKVAERTAELQRSAQGLQRSEFYLAEGQRLGHTGSWALSPSGFFEYWSRELFQIYGLDPQKGAPTLEQYLATIHPQDRDFMAETIKRMCEQGSGCDAKKRIIRPDGAVRYIRWVGIPVLDNGVLKRFLGTAMDVTEQEQLTQELQRREAYLAEAQRLSQTGSWAWSPDQGITYWSEECCRVLGFDPKDGLPRAEEFFQRIHPDDQPGFMELVETGIREKAEWKADYRIVHPDGPVRDIHVVCHPVLSTSGHLAEFLGTVIDVTERKSAEQEREKLRQLEADLAHTNRVSTLGEMAASLAHEIKQPIAAAITSANSCLEWLAHEPPNLDRARAAAARIDKYGNRAAEIIDRIRSFYKKSPPQRELVDVNGIIHEILTLLKGEANRYSVAMHTELASELPKIMVDRVQLQQVFMNLMLNAIEAMKDSGGELTVKSELQDGQLQFAVSDTGVGLPTEKMDQIFSAFFTTKPQGSGMGLSISRSIVESHGGRLWATANDGRGATFYFTLPTHMPETSSQVNLVTLE
jgi:PAS domain S-box-containing protein